MKFKVGDIVVIKSTATKNQLDDHPNLKTGMCGRILSVTSKRKTGEGLNLFVDWASFNKGVYYDQWWIDQNAVELYSKENLICDKVKAMYERQPFVKNKTVPKRKDAKKIIPSTTTTTFYRVEYI